MSFSGIDYAFSPHPAVSVTKGGGYHFVCRYISKLAANDRNGKNLLANEAQDLLAAGLGIVVVV
jgi:hypothetical protein